MTPEQIEARFQRIEELLIATAESQRLTSESQQRTIEELLTATAESQRLTFESQRRTSESLAETEAIANSNARSIEAITNAATETRQDLARLVNIVADFVEATNTRLRTLEN